MHSIAVEPFLDLDTAQHDTEISNVIAATLQNTLSGIGPARVTPISRKKLTTAPEDRSEEAANRWNSARAAIQGTKRLRNGKLCVSLRLLNTADGKVLYKKIINDAGPESVAKLTGAQLYGILNIHDLASVELTETDPGWRDKILASSLSQAGPSKIDLPLLILSDLFNFIRKQ